MFDVAFGAELTTDYMSRGTTQTDGGPAIQGYVEADYGKFYAGVWASNVDYGFPDTEVDFSVGWRPEWGKWAFDFGAVYYYYAVDTGTSYADLYAQTDYTVNDWLTVGGQLWVSPDYVQTGTSAVYGLADTTISLPANFSISGQVGYQEFERSYGSSYWTWNLGVSYAWKDLTFDLRYWDTNLSRGQCGAQNTRSNSCDARVVASVSFDTSASAFQALSGMGR